MNTIYLDRLEENACIDFNSGFWWDGFNVTLNDVSEYIKQGGNGTSVPYGDTFRHPQETKDKDYHVSRVAYFVLNPEEISGLEIDNNVYENYILPQAIVVDGWHRLLAAKYLGLEKIKVYYGGRMDVLRYLQKRRKTEPFD